MEEFEKRCDIATQRREISLYYKATKESIEFKSKNMPLQMPNEIKENILKK